MKATYSSISLSSPGIILYGSHWRRSSIYYLSIVGRYTLDNSALKFVYEYFLQDFYITRMHCKLQIRIMLEIGPRSKQSIDTTYHRRSCFDIFLPKAAIIEFCPGITARYHLSIRVDGSGMDGTLRG